MKRKNDPRHKERIKTMKALFKASFLANPVFEKGSTASQVMAEKKKIDELIKKNAPTWPIEQISPVDLATLRLAIWELAFKKQGEPYKVIIDEAVELAKEFGSEASPSFINGVLGSIVKSRLEK